jgi:hypothetical protein
MNANPKHQPLNVRVEVSGWNQNQDFFVETTGLDVADAKPILRLRTPVRPGMLLFVRTLTPAALRREFPMPCRVEAVVRVCTDGTRQVVIEGLHPEQSVAMQLQEAGLAAAS